MVAMTWTEVGEVALEEEARKEYKVLCIIQILEKKVEEGTDTRVPHINVMVQKVGISALLDTGATCNCIRQDVFHKICQGDTEQVKWVPQSNDKVNIVFRTAFSNGIRMNNVVGRCG